MHSEENISRLIALGYELGYGGREVNRWRELYKEVSVGRPAETSPKESCMLH